MSVLACCLRAPSVVDGGVDTAVDQVVEANFVGYDRPVPVPIFLVKCENTAEEIEEILRSYKPDFIGNAVYGREEKALWSLRQRAEECLTILRYNSSQPAASSTGERASTALGAAVDRWDESRPSDRAYFLDGGSSKSLYRCIAYHYSGAVGAIKQLLCEPSAYTIYPVAVEHAVVIFRFLVEHMSTMYLAFWAEPRGFTDLRACIHMAEKQGITGHEDKQEQLLDLLESLKALDVYFHSPKFNSLRSKVKRIPHPPPWPEQMPTYSELDRRDEARSSASLGSADHEYAAISSPMDHEASDAIPHKRPSSQNQPRKEDADVNDLYGSGSVSRGASSKVVPASGSAAKPAAAQQQGDSNTVSFMKSSDSESPARGSGLGKSPRERQQEPAEQDLKSFMSVDALPAPPPPARNPLSATNSVASTDDHQDNAGPGTGLGAMKPGAMVADTGSDLASSVANHKTNADGSQGPSTHNDSDATMHPAKPSQAGQIGMPKKGRVPDQNKLITHTPMDASSDLLEVGSRVNGHTQMSILQTGLHTKRPGKSRPGSPRGPSPTATVFSEISGSVANLRRPVPSVAAAVAAAAVEAANAKDAAEEGGKDRNRTSTTTPHDSGSLQNSMNNKSPFPASPAAGSSSEHEPHKRPGSAAGSRRKGALPDIAETPNESPASSPGAEGKKRVEGAGSNNDEYTEAAAKPWLQQASDNPFAKGVAPADQGAWEPSGDEAEEKKAARLKQHPSSTKRPSHADSLAGKHSKKQSVVASWIMAAFAGRQSADQSQGADANKPDEVQSKQPSLAAALMAGSAASSPPDSPTDNPFRPEDGSGLPEGAPGRPPSNIKRIKPPLPDSEPQRTLMNAQTPPRHSLEALSTPHEDTSQNSGHVLKNGHLPSLHARTHDINAPSATDPSSQPFGMETEEMAWEDEGTAADAPSRPSLRKVPTQPISPLSPLAEQSTNAALSPKASSPAPLQPGVWAPGHDLGNTASASASRMRRAEHEAAGDSLEADMAALASPGSQKDIGQYASEGGLTARTTRSSHRDTGSGKSRTKSLWGAVRNTLKLPSRSRREAEALSAAYESDGISSALLPGMPAPAMMIGGLHASGVLGDSSTLLAKIAEKHGSQRPKKAKSPQPAVPTVFSSASKAPAAAASTAAQSAEAKRPSQTATATTRPGQNVPKQPDQAAQRGPERRPRYPPAWDDRLNSTSSAGGSQAAAGPARKPSLAASRGEVGSTRWSGAGWTGTAARPRSTSSSSSNAAAAFNSGRAATAAVAATKFSRLKDRSAAQGPGIRPRLPPGDGSFLQRSETVASSAALQTGASTHSRIPHRTNTIFSNVSVETAGTNTPTTAQRHRRPSAFSNITRPSGPNLSTANRGASRYRQRTQSSSFLDTGGQDGSALHSVTSTTAAGSHMRKGSRVSSTSGAPKRGQWR